MIRKNTGSVMTLNTVDTSKAVYAVHNTLRRIDGRLIDHGERVAFISNKICDAGGFDLDKKALFLLCVFHDIGAYETEEIERLFEFETMHEHVRRHSVYGYLFLKHMTPLSEWAEVILYHHYSAEELLKVDERYGKYAALIHLADRIDVAVNYEKDNDQVPAIMEKNRDIFREDYYAVAEECLKNGSILPKLRDKSFEQENKKLSAQFIHSSKEAFDYLNMIVYAIDFLSEHTVTHTVNTVAIAVYIAESFKLSDVEIEQTYIGALLHDIGKIAIDRSILESSGRLTEEQMLVMKTHVEETGVLIENVVPDEIYKIAVRHHEKLDGSGYPLGLCAEQLSIPQRIVAVADIISALSSKRSYKEPFAKEKTVSIIKDMMQTQLDPSICKFVLENYDSIIAETEQSRKQTIDMYLRLKTDYKKMMDDRCLEYKA